MLSGWWRLLDQALRVIMAIFLFAMMMITSADVVGRYAFTSPIPGGFEIVQYLMALVVFASLPLTTAVDGHLSVALLPPRKTGHFGYVHRVFIRLVSALALALIAWRMGEQALSLDRAQQISGYLQLPLAPIAWAMTGLAAVAFVLILGKLLTAILGREQSRDDSKLLPRGVD